MFVLVCVTAKQRMLNVEKVVLRSVLFDDSMHRWSASVLFALGGLQELGAHGLWASEGEVAYDLFLQFACLIDGLFRQEKMLK